MNGTPSNGTTTTALLPDVAVIADEVDDTTKAAGRLFLLKRTLGLGRP